MVTTLTLAAVLAVFWQLYTLRGELSGFAAATRHTPADDRAAYTQMSR